MRLVRALLCIALIGAPCAAAAPTASASAMSMDASPAVPAQARADFEAAWVGVFYRCADEAAARRVIGAVQAARPTSAEAALPALAAGVARHRCVVVGDDHEWTDMPLEIEFEEDGQGLQLITAKDRNGRPIALIYRRGAC